ncbi:MAG: toprim domain-containing protein [Neisseriaceae bacterium]|nr:toprim domain-containing protein [Neisseriaceae bacterium]
MKDTFKSAQIGKSNIGYIINQAKQNGWQREKPQALSAAEIAERNRRNAEIKRQAEIERQQKAHQAAIYAQKVWDNAKPADPNHPYLRSKGIETQAVLDAIRQDKDALLIPLKNHGKIVGIQKIFENGEKRFNYDIQKKGSAFVIGNRAEMTHGFLMAEGFATAATLHQATGRPVVVAFDAGNLKDVANNLKGFVEKHQAKVLICADKDESGTGEVKALNAQEVLGNHAQIVLPDFTADEIQNFQAAHNGKNPTDFNDLQAIGGIERVNQTLVGWDITPPKEPNIENGGSKTHPTSENSQSKLLINIYGAPATGKSYTAETLTALMNEHGIQTALVTEYATDLIKQGRQDELKDQVKVTSEQLNREQEALKTANLVITDSPTRLGTIYAPENQKAEVAQIAEQSTHTPSINIFLQHNAESLEAYAMTNRIHNANQSLEIQSQLAEMLSDTPKITTERGIAMEELASRITQTQEWQAFAKENNVVLELSNNPVIESDGGVGLRPTEEDTVIASRDLSRRGNLLTTESESSLNNDKGGSKTHPTTQTTENIKAAQAAFILRENPAPDEHKVWIRSIDDIVSIDELQNVDEDSDDYPNPTPDFSRDDFLHAVEKGTITVYHGGINDTLQNGEFVTPSKMYAQDYGSKVVSQEVSITDLAFIKGTNGLEAMYIPQEVLQVSGSLNDEKTQRQQGFEAVNTINQEPVFDTIDNDFEKETNNDNRTNRANPPTTAREISISENADRAGISGNGSGFSTDSTIDARILQTFSTPATVESTESTGIVMARPERSAWGDFPPLLRNGSLEEMKSHPDYIAAKSGDFSAANKMVDELIKPETLQQINQMIGDKKPIVIAVQAEESAGRNRIPAALANAIAEYNDWEVDNKIFQADHIGRTGTDSSFRLAFNPVFRGEVEQGRDYLIVDDNSTMGGTIASLKGYIENRGGKVLGGVVLSARKTALDIVPTQKQFNNIQEKFGEEPNHYWEQEFGYGIDKLTRGEVGVIRTSPTFELIKVRIDHARATVQALIDAKTQDNPNPDNETPRPPQGGFVLPVENENRQAEQINPKENIMAEQDKLTPSEPLEKQAFQPDAWQPENFPATGSGWQPEQNSIDFADDRQMVIDEVERPNETPEMTNQEKVQAVFETLQNQYNGYRFNPENNRLEIENSQTKEAVHFDEDKLIYTAEMNGERKTIGDIDVKDLSPEYLALSIENRRLTYNQELLQNGFPNAEKRQELDQNADRLDDSVREAKRKTETLTPPEAPPAELSERYLAVKRQFMDNATHYGEKTNIGIKTRVDYVDAQNGKTVLFSDKGNKLVSAVKHPDEQQIKDMLEVARAKGWDSIKVSGNKEFRRQSWLMAESQGIKVKGYSPSKEDLALLEQMRERNSTNQIEERGQEEPKDKEVEKNAPETANTTALKGGILLEHGAAHYQFDKEKTMSYYAMLEMPNGEKQTLWGKEIEKTLQDGKVEIGDRISLSKNGYDMVTVQMPVKDENGKVMKDENGKIITEPTETRRNHWDLTVHERVREPEQPENNHQDSSPATPSHNDGLNSGSLNNDKQQALKEQGIAYAMAEKINDQSLADTYADGSGHVPDDVAAATTNLKNQSDVRVGRAKTSPMQVAKQRYLQKFDTLSDADKAKHLVYERDLKTILANGSLTKEQHDAVMANFYNNAGDKIQNGQSLLPKAVGLENITLNQHSNEKDRTGEVEMER